MSSMVHSHPPKAPKARLERGHSDDLTQTVNLDLGGPKGATAGDGLMEVFIGKP